MQSATATAGEISAESSSQKEDSAEISPAVAVKSPGGGHSREMLFLRVFVPCCGFFVLIIFKVILRVHISLQTF